MHALESLWAGHFLGEAKDTYELEHFEFGLGWFCERKSSKKAKKLCYTLRCWNWNAFLAGRSDYL